MKQKNKYITINHFDDCRGYLNFRVGDILTLKKDHNNDYDDEAIGVYKDNDYKYGYVANSVYTVARGTYSAGRIYDQLEEESKCIVRFITENMLIAEVYKNVK